MPVRDIIEIDEEKCNGCGQCVTACAEGAIQLIDGKAKLVSEVYCDGLGACIGTCPTGALKVIKRDCEAFDEQKVKDHLAKNKVKVNVNIPPQFPHHAGCPGSMARSLQPRPQTCEETTETPSQLQNWPIQLHLVSPYAPWLQGANILLAADCTAFSMGAFHAKMLKDHVLMIACPKLDDTTPYVSKLAEIISHNTPASLAVVHMEVPCCTGLFVIA
ncbi:MAG: 4Fe-4S dicluster domain-containing protein, partial [Lentisphaerae bacterium]